MSKGSQRSYSGNVMAAVMAVQQDVDGGLPSLTRNRADQRIRQHFVVDVTTLKTNQGIVFL